MVGYVCVSVGNQVIEVKNISKNIHKSRQDLFSKHILDKYNIAQEIYCETFNFRVPFIWRISIFV